MASLQLRSLVSKARTFQPVCRNLSTTTSRSYEYFAMVWDRPKARRPEFTLLAPSGRLPGLTFAGDMLATQPNGVNEPAVCGNCFAVKATSIADVIERLRAHRFCQEGIWDAETIKVWPLETVLTSHMGAKSFLEVQ